MLDPRKTTLLALLLLAAASPLLAQGHEHHEMPDAANVPAPESLGAMTIPDTLLLDQDGREVHFFTDLVEGRVVVINFIFTTCTTICPPMGANFAKLQKLLGERVERDVGMISVSVDPAVDTPPRLKAWAEKLGRRPGWTLVTGQKPEVDKLLKALKVFTPDKTDHSPIVLVGDERRNEWTRAYGLAPPAKLAETVNHFLEDPAAEYFTDVPLVNQDGEKLRLYSDLMKDKVVVINSLFTTCEGVCPVTMDRLAKVQEWLGPRLGTEVLILSLTVDGENDTPPRLHDYARKWKAKPGWHFLTGSPEDLEFALRRLGLWVEDKEAHSPVFLVGNVSTGLWKKAFGMAPAPELVAILESVLYDRLETAATPQRGRGEGL